MSRIKTRETARSGVSRLVGTGRELIPSELPTARDILRYAVLKREQGEDRRNYNVDQLIRDVTTAVTAQWEKANTLFTWPMMNHRSTVTAKFKSLWVKAVAISQDKKGRERDQFVQRLDRLVDILNCQCYISKCSEVGCGSCKNGAHVFCKCPRAQKIPVLELAFIKGQRDKVGSIRPFQIGS